MCACTCYVCNLCVFVDIALAVLMMCINQSCTETVTARVSQLERERERERTRERVGKRTADICTFIDACLT